MQRHPCRCTPCCYLCVCLLAHIGLHNAWPDVASPAVALRCLCITAWIFRFRFPCRRLRGCMHLSSAQRHCGAQAGLDRLVPRRWSWFLSAVSCYLVGVALPHLLGLARAHWRLRWCLDCGQGLHRGCSERGEIATADGVQRDRGDIGLHHRADGGRHTAGADKLAFRCTHSGIHILAGWDPGHSAPLPGSNHAPPRSAPRA
mmetsp:Transcript_113750/g.321684  ORF Transcript_113750/g.321684 Transcript_113750/m.321684 type:complete len:202 (+) Transcript_113750:109-714(+)